MIVLRFLPQARRELLDQIDYYASIQENLGARFESAVSTAIQRALANPDHGAPRSRSTRRLRVKGFPFSVIYRASAGVLLIVAIADARRRPDYWAGRLG